MHNDARRRMHFYRPRQTHIRMIGDEYILWRPWHARARLSRGFRLGLVCARAPHSLSVVRFPRHTLSRRRGRSSRPTGPLTARVLMDSGSARPRVSNRAPGNGWGLLRRVISSVSRRLKLSLSRLPLSWPSLGTARLVALQLVSARPRAPAGTRPLGHSPVFSHFRSKTCLYR